MTTSAINHRPIPFVAAAAAVAVIAAGSLALSLSHEGSTPGPQPPISLVPTSQAHHFQATTSGGRTMLGQ